MQTEFIACYEATTQAVWLKNFVSGLHIVDSISNSINIYWENA